MNNKIKLIRQGKNKNNNYFEEYKVLNPKNKFWDRFLILVNGKKFSLRIIRFDNWFERKGRFEYQEAINKGIELLSKGGE